jgi:hypothetical protein
VTDKLIAGMQSITRLLWTAAALLAPWLVPVGSAIIFGWAMYGTALGLGMLRELAVVVGVVTAVGLETVNIAAAHAALQLSHDREQHAGKFALACVLVAFYVVLGIFAVWHLAITPAARIISASMFLLTPVAITAQALTLDLARTQHEAQGEREREREREVEALAWEREREREREQEERQYRLELARLRWEAKIAMADSDRTVTGQQDSDRTQAGRWPDKAAFMSDPDRTQISVSDLVTGGVHPRTARRWVAETKDGHNGS